MFRPCLLYVGTGDGIFVFRASEKKLELVGRGLEGNAVRGIAVHPKDSRIAYVACGLRGWGLYKTEDAGQSWELVGFKDRWAWDVAIHPHDPKTLYVGTEPPMIYISCNAGRTFQACEGIERLPSRKHWKFFYEPFYAGHIHGIALHPQCPERIFAGVEHGALIYSYDDGKTWHEALVGHDLHRIALDPLNPDRVFAGTGEGLFMSDDAGQTWKAVPKLTDKYVHGIYFDRHNAQRVYLYVAEAGSPLYRSDDGGRSFALISTGLPEDGPADSFSIHPDQSEVLFYGGEVRERRGQLFVSADAGASWQLLGDELPKIWRVRTGKL
ncbi:MAG: hypothetical protein NZ610_03140 [Candidatus Bipolaricaulota bacterium]|nr:hypothetical protein [Candidatus Bipolaricaulota bacterium]MCS7274387.1 hypothetical protein [Candidatus Bipolaricaulota bacterium]MDW8110505.1 hypothetical protein [Candidatus Bipolaricaulota bacterium]MDW8329961.1 hypothetical protein [Candidatus Bipolaricaulota bacterium]